jgi:opacity protein-like surface antigen
MRVPSGFHSLTRGALCLVLFATAMPAFAEWHADLYGGAAYTPPSEVTLVVRPPGLEADHVFHDLKWDPSAEYGARLGYWLESVPWCGVGLDVFRFDANIPGQTVNTTILGVTAPATLQAINVSVTAFAIDIVRLRYPIALGGDSPDFPHGRLQPYVTAGPALFRVKATNTANGELSTTPANDSSWGYKVGAGLSWQLTKGTAIFGEYRYTHVHTEPVFDSGLSSLRVPMTFDLNTHHGVVGLSFRF